MITVKGPSECLPTEIHDFAAFVLAGGEVTADGLEARIRKAERLVFLASEGCLKGIAAIKNPEKGYKEGLFREAQASVGPELFSFELGWVFVLPSSRGAGFSHKLVKAALSVTDDKAVFATSRTDNIPMHKALRAQGFSCHGRPYVSTRGDYHLALFVLNPAQGVPADRLRFG